MRTLASAALIIVGAMSISLAVDRLGADLLTSVALTSGVIFIAIGTQRE